MAENCTAVVIAAIGWHVAFTTLMAYWLASEAMQPGQQYADPLLPCAFCAMFGIPAAFGVSLIVGLVNRR